MLRIIDKIKPILAMRHDLAWMQWVLHNSIETKVHKLSLIMIILVKHD